MNFEDAFKHYQEGNATQEEKDFVLDELAKAKAFSPLLDDEGINVTPAPIAEADIIAVKKAKQEYKWRNFTFIVASVAVVLVLLATILGAVFGTASHYANQHIVYDKPACVQAAKEYAYDFVTNNPMPGTPGFLGSIDEITVKDVHKDFHYNPSKINLSYYCYRIELNAGAFEFEIDVDTRVLTCVIVDVN